MAVIGSGCAGLGAAWHLNRSGVNVTRKCISSHINYVSIIVHFIYDAVFESDARPGGHANTVNVNGVGMIIYQSTLLFECNIISIWIV